MRPVAACFALLLVTACARPSAKRCTSDFDCPRAAICRDTYCYEWTADASADASAPDGSAQTDAGASDAAAVDGGSGDGGNDGGDAGATCATTGCATGFYCDSASGQCLAGCGSDPDCPQPGSCDLGTHTCSCAPGHHLCGSACADDTSPLTCGAMCQPCSAPSHATATCVTGSCGFTCDPGWLRCGSDCCQASAVFAGTLYSCALLSTGTMKCWGLNQFGELGDGTIINRLTPVDTLNLSGVTAMTGRGQTCALAGLLWCWGDNAAGQVGDNTYQLRTSPVNPFFNAMPASISAGDGFTCGVNTSGQAYCWGRNGDGELGDGTTTSSPKFVSVAGFGISGGAQAAAGGSHACILKTDQTIVCWGLNNNGQLGSGDKVSSTSPGNPIILPPPATASSVAAGGDFTCALLTSGGVVCWGDNTLGQAGDGSGTEQDQAVQVSGLTSGVSKICAGNDHACALLATGAIKCWGSDSKGQLGDGAPANKELSPVDVQGSSGATDVSCGAQSSCAVVGGGVKCWGRNDFGQLGDGTTTDRYVPVDVSGQ